MLNGSPETVFLGILPARLRIHELEGPLTEELFDHHPHYIDEKTEAQSVTLGFTGRPTQRRGSLVPTSFSPPPIRIWLPTHTHLCPPVQKSLPCAPRHLLPPGRTPLLPGLSHL